MQKAEIYSRAPSIACSWMMRSGEKSLSMRLLLNLTWDTTLQNDPIKYGQFVKDLWEKGMLRFTSEPKDLVTPFFVVKKNGKLRFILDCRGVNKRFRPPPALALAAGSSWSQVSIPKGSKMFVAQSDIKDYFYSLELPHALQPLFCLPPLPSSVVQEWSSTFTRASFLTFRLGLADASSSTNGVVLGDVFCSACAPTSLP